MIPKTDTVSSYIHNKHVIKQGYKSIRRNRIESVAERHREAHNSLYGIVADRIPYIVTYFDEYIPLVEFDRYA